jgi:predicted RNA-binding Zn-ribbon protein involved in translation (DUF1610 family)
VKLWTPRQVAACSGCGLVLRERKRKPCPRCGDLRRSVNRSANESLGALDRA